MHPTDINQAPVNMSAMKSPHEPYIPKQTTPYKIKYQICIMLEDELAVVLCFDGHCYFNKVVGKKATFQWRVEGVEGVSC